MLQIKSNYSLQPLNTFGIQANAKFYLRIDSAEQLPKLVINPVYRNNEVFILGGGSNILFTDNFEGLVLHVNIQGIEKADEDDTSVLIVAGGGIVWDEFVSYAVSNNWGGIENLSAIPGTVGAAPMQNIGAYGVEVKDWIEKVEGYDFTQQQFLSFSNKECRFQYRDSLFKQKFRNRFVITRVFFRLKKAPHKLITRYGDIARQLNELPEQNIAALRELIIHIRESKLPDYRKKGNAGSFFKNPVLQHEQVLPLKKEYPDMPVFPDEKGKEKLSAAWLIDKAGCKGIQQGKAGTHPQHALVLINLGGATGSEIFRLAQQIQKTVREKFGIMLEPEVNIL